mgnify:FL=1
MINIFGLTVEELTKVLEPFQVPKYRAKQLAEWMYLKGVNSFAEMTNLSK